MRKGHWSTYQWLGIMSRMSREVHVRFWERLGVKFPRATRQVEKFRRVLISVCFGAESGPQRQERPLTAQ